MYGSGVVERLGGVDIELISEKMFREGDDMFR
jgi:hypothetical protein